MRRLLPSTMLVLAVLLPAGVHAQANEDRAAIQRVITAFADGIHTNSLADIDGLFAPNGVHILVDNAALHGWDEYREELLMPEMARYGELRYAHTGIETSLRGNIGWVAFRWQMSSVGDGPAPSLGRASAVLEKVSGNWRIAHLHMSR